MACIAVLEDEIALREEVAYFLEGCGHSVLQAGSLADFWPLLPRMELAILDILLPDGSGMDAAARLHQESPWVGIIMLTARSSSEDQLRGLYGGADHYLVKPCRFRELAAIVDALLRRVGAGWRFAVRQRRLIAPNGFSISLNIREAALFELLSTRPGAIVTQRALVKACGEDWLHFDERRIYTLVSRLRRRWREGCGLELPLKTEYAEGFSFGATIQQI